MAEEYKVEIGAQAKESEFDAIEQRIKRITDKEYPITFKIDAKTEKSLGDLKNALDNIEKSNPKLDLNLDVNEITAVKKGLVGLGNTIEKISRVFDALDKSTTSLSGLDGLFTGSLKGLSNVNANLADFKSTFNDIENAIERTISSIDQLKKKTNNFTPSFDLGIKRSASEKNALIESMSSDLMPDLKNQAEKLMKELNIRDIFDADAFAGKYFKGSVVQHSTRFRELYREAFQGMHQLSKGERQATSIEQTSAYRNLINQLREYANVSGKNVSLLDSEFASIGNRLKELDDIASGADIDERLKNIFNIDTSKMEDSLERIAKAIDKVNESLDKFGQGDLQAFTSIVTDLQKISEEFKQVKAGLENLNGAFNQFNGDQRFQELSKSFSDLASAIRQITNTCTGIESAIDSGSQAFSQMDNVVIQAQSHAQSLAETMRAFGIDQSEIDEATQKLRDLNITVTDVVETLRTGKNLDFKIKGIDQYGRDVTANLAYRMKKRKGQGLQPEISLTTSIHEKVGDIVKPIDEAEEAYQKMVDLRKQINLLNKESIGLDPKEDKNYIDEITRQRSRAYREYEKLSSKYYERLSKDQKEELSNIDKAANEERRRLESKEKDRENREQDIELSKLVQEEENKRYKLEERLQKLRVQQKRLEVAGGHETEVGKLNGQISDVQKEISNQTAEVDPDKLANIIKEADAKISLIEARAKDIEHKVAAKSVESFNEKVGKESNRVEASFKKIKNATVETQKAYNDYSDAIKAMDNASKSGTDQEKIAALNKYKNALIEVENQIRKNVTAEKNTNATKKLDANKRAFESGMDVWLQRNSEAADYFADRIANIRQRLKECDTTELSQLRTEFTDLKRQAELAGKTVKSFGDRLQDQFKAFGTYFALDNIIDEAIEGIRDMYDQVVQIDTAMTDLYKVTDETPERYEQFLGSAQKGAKELGRSVSSYITQSAKWAQMGYGIGDSEQLAKISSIYSNVADVDDATAVSDIISNLKAFNIDASDAITVVDSLNKLSNEFAVTAAGLGQGLTNSASAMAMSNATFEQTIALLTGITEITQSPSEAGSFLKVASMRIRGMKGALEELGEEVDSNVDSISKVQTQILNLTGGMVNIFDANGEFRNYYDIMKDIAGIYDSLTSTQQSSLTEILFGKMRGNQGAAMIQAFKSGQIDKAYQAALNSEGSAYAEQEKWANSLEARIGRISASWQSLSETIMNSDFLKGGMDLLIGFMNGLEGILDQFGTLPTLLAGVMGALSFNDVGELIKQFHYSITLENEYAHEVA